MSFPEVFSRPFVRSGGRCTPCRARSDKPSPCRTIGKHNFPFGINTV
jgi:hypothetical protein